MSEDIFSNVILSEIIIMVERCNMYLFQNDGKGVMIMS